MSQQQTRAERVNDAKQGMKVAFLTLPIWGICALFGYAAIGFNLCCLAGILGIIIQVKQELHSCKWFWILLAVIVVVHIPLVVWAPWNGKRFMGVQMKPVFFADSILIYFLVYLGEKVFSRKIDSANEPSETLPSLLD